MQKLTTVSFTITINVYVPRIMHHLDYCNSYFYCTNGIKSCLQGLTNSQNIYLSGKTLGEGSGDVCVEQGGHCWRGGWGAVGAACVYIVVRVTV